MPVQEKDGEAGKKRDENMKREMKREMDNDENSSLPVSKKAKRYFSKTSVGSSVASVTHDALFVQSFETQKAVRINYGKSAT